MKHSALPVLLAAAVAGACFAVGASTSTPAAGTPLADIPGSTRMYTAEQVAALFSSLDGTNASAALARILAADAELYSNVVALHERDAVRSSATNLVLDPGRDEEYAPDESRVYVHADYPEQRVVVWGDLVEGAQMDSRIEDDWAVAFRTGLEMKYEMDERSLIVDEFFNAFDRADQVSSEIDSNLPSGAIELLGLNFDGLMLFATNPPTSCHCDAASIESRLTALENRPTCACSLSDLQQLATDLQTAVTALQGVASDLSSIVTAASDLNSRLSALETAVRNLSPSAVAQNAGITVEEATAILDQAADDAAAAADDVSAIADAASEIESFGDAVDDVAEEVDAIVDILGEV